LKQAAAREPLYLSAHQRSTLILLSVIP